MIKKILITSFILLAGCTDNFRTRNWGGTMTKTLPPGQKLVNATWKNGDLWILSRKMRPDEVPEVHAFQEDSESGILEGTVIIQEQETYGG